MAVFSALSLQRLATCDARLQRLFNDVIQSRDCSILVGHRDAYAQAVAVATGKSKTPWPTSKHNSDPSLAVDVAPYPIDWSDIQAFKDFADFVLERAAVLGVPIRWGGDFTTIRDYDHFEIFELAPGDGITGTDHGTSA